MHVMICAVALLRVAVRAGPLPDNLVLKIVLAENLVEHHLDVVAGVPVQW